MVGMTQGAAALAVAPLPTDLSVDPGDLKRAGAAKPAPSVFDHKEVEGCVNALFTLLECYGCISRHSPSSVGTRVLKSYNGTLKHWVGGASACGSWMK